MFGQRVLVGINPESVQPIKPCFAKIGWQSGSAPWTEVDDNVTASTVGYRDSVLAKFWYPTDHRVFAVRVLLELDAATRHEIH
jgi:hypothetical protein